MTLLSTPTARGIERAPREPWLAPAAIGLDALVVVAAGLLAARLRDSLPLLPPAPSDDVVEQLGAAGPLVLLLWLAAIGIGGGYNPRVFGPGPEEYRLVLRSSMMTAGVVGIGAYVMQYPLSRGFFVLTFVVGVPLLLAGRFGIRRALYRWHRAGHGHKQVIIAGSASQVDEVAAVLRRDSWVGLSVLGAALPNGQVGDETPGGIPVLGASEEAPSIACTRLADVLLLTSSAQGTSQKLRHIAWQLEHSGVQLVVAPGVTDVAAERVRVRPLGGMPLVYLDPPLASRTARGAKRAFDLTLGALSLLAALPLLAVAAMWIKLHDGGPVLFRQTRIGRNGDEFGCWKLRTMVPDASQRPDELYQQVGHRQGLFKMARDPRVTRPGRVLRRLSIDELPQLLNVLRGDMSLVGPRPALPHEVASYAPDVVRRLRVRPGLTGLWQVSGRSDLPWDETVRLDLFYADNWSMMQDLSIIARTVRAVLSSSGAY